MRDNEGKSYIFDVMDQRETWRNAIPCLAECSTGCLWCDIDSEGQQTCTICDTGYVLAAGECKGEHCCVYTEYGGQAIDPFLTLIIMCVYIYWC
jgi:hypothetical protein